MEILDSLKMSINYMNTTNIIAGKEFKRILSFESRRCTVHFVKSLQLLTNKCTYITFTKNTLNHSDMLRSFQIIIREFRRSLLKFLHIHDIVRFCKQGVVAAYHVVLESAVQSVVD